MDYLSLLTKEEVNALCGVISGKTIRKLFIENPKEFGKIKPGFRANKISEDEAVSLASQNINRPFLKFFLNRYTEDLLKYGEHNISALKLQGQVEEQAIAETLADSPFNGHIELYFKLVGRSVDKEYIDDIKNVF